MKKNGMKRLTMAGILFLGMVAMGSPLAAQSRFSIGIGVGGFGVGFGAPGYYAPAPVVAYQPPCPGPGYSWVDGYYNPYGVWIGGYWAAPRPYYGYGPGFYGGYRRGFDHDGFRGGRGWGHERGRGYGYRGK